MALKTGNRYLDALGGEKWSGGNHYSPRDGALILTVYFDNDTSKNHSTAGAWTPEQKSEFWDALHAWSSVANVRFLEVENTRAADLIERKVTMEDLGGTKENPGPYAQHGSPDFRTALIGEYSNIIGWTQPSINEGGFTHEVLVHELGHALGLSHPHEMTVGTGLFPGVSNGVATDTGDNGLNHTLYTIMSYNHVDGRGDGYGHSATPMAFDIAAIQLMYGAVQNNAGNTVYTLPDTNSAGTNYSSIWDTGGVDTIQYNGAGNATIDLRPATLANEVGGGGFLSSVEGIIGGFTIAADITDFDRNGNLGVIIENGVGGSGNDTITGNEAANRLQGNGGHDTLAGGGGRDTLYGGADNDWLDGEAQADWLYGGTGNDTYRVGDGDEVFENAFGYFDHDALRYVAPGVDTVETFLSVYWLPANVENLTFLDDGLDIVLPWVTPSAYTGHGNELDNVIVGSRGADTLFGYGGEDTLNGGAGDDRMFGGADNDIYYIDSYGDTVSEEIAPFGYSEDAGGIDEIRTNLPVYALPETMFTVIENMSYLGTERFIGLGNSANNYMHGGNGGDADNGDTLMGFGGSDQLYGFGGGDLIIGGAENDGMDGGDGNDTFIMDNGNVIGGDVAIGGNGYDLVRADQSVAATGLRLNLFYTGTPVEGEVNLTPYTSAAIGVEFVEGSIGNDFVNASRLGATWEAISFTGAEGNDILVSGGGGHWFHGGADTDTIVYADAASNYRITPSEYDVRDFLIEDLRTGRLDQVRDVEFVRFNGINGTDVLLGGNNTAPAGQIFDGTAYWGGSIQGGAGVDTVSYANANYSIYVDLLRDGGYAEGLGQSAQVSSIENITGSSTLLNSLHGNQEDNVLIGGDHVDWLTGRGGNNTLDGSGGVFDTADYYETNAPVTIDLTQGRVFHSTGVDTVANIEQFRGTNHADTFIGDGANNYFQGMNGGDRIAGGTGDDWLVGGSGADTFLFRDADIGRDRIADFNFAEGDRIDFSEHATVNQLSHLTITDSSAGAVINYATIGGMSSIVLDGVSASSIHNGWFVF